jgi:hypothetical protein
MSTVDRVRATDEEPGVGELCSPADAASKAALARRGWRDPVAAIAIYDGVPVAQEAGLARLDRGAGRYVNE